MFYFILYSALEIVPIFFISFLCLKKALRKRLKYESENNLVSQPEPKVENSPYFELQQKHKVKIDFILFI
jgi:hypothetical protein